MVTEDVNLIRSGPPGAVRRLLDGRSAARARPQHGDRGPLRRHAVARPAGPTLNYNELNILENGFLERVQARAGEPAGERRRRPRQHVRATAAPAPARSPLPIMSWRTSTGAGDRRQRRGVHVGELRTNNTFLNPLATYNPNPFDVRRTTSYARRRRSAPTRADAGLPANFFLANPDLLGGANLTTNGGKTDYNSLQLELRRRLSQGLQFSASYVFGNASSRLRQTLPPRRLHGFATPATGRHHARVQGERRLRAAVRPGPALRRQRQRRSSIASSAAGSSSGVARIQSGRLVDLGNVRLVGMTRTTCRTCSSCGSTMPARRYGCCRRTSSTTRSRRSASARRRHRLRRRRPPTGRYFAPANGPDCIEIDNGADYGDCGMRSLVVTGPMFQQHDFSVVEAHHDRRTRRTSSSASRC